MNLAMGHLITGIALLGLAIARAVVARTSRRSDVAARLRTLYTLVGALLALRLIAPLVAAAPVAVALMTVAAWLPLAGLRLVEELCRRHAPRAVKIAALAGALFFTGLALTLGLVWSEANLIALAIFQSLMLATMVGLLARARSELAPAERRTAETFLLALLLAAPLALTDSSALFPGLPVRGGPIAVLLLVLTTSRLAASRGTPLRLLADLAVLAGAGAVAALSARLAVPGIEAATAGELAASAAAAAALLLLIERSMRSRMAQPGLVEALAASVGQSRDAILSAHPLLESGRMLQGTDLDLYPATSLARVLEHAVVSADLDDPEARDAGRDLLDATGATHLLRISRQPPRLLAVTAGGLAGRALDDELALAAQLIERAE